jgi:hypothetical protein
MIEIDSALWTWSVRDEGLAIALPRRVELVAARVAKQVGNVMTF